MTLPLPRLLLPLALAALAFPATAESIRGSGTPKTETRNVTGFTAISLELPGRLELTQGDREAVVVTADDNVVGEIETVVENGALKLRFKRNLQSVRNVKIQIAVTAKSLAALSLSGSGDVVAANLKTQAFAVNVSGSGDLKIGALEAGPLTVSIGGSGDVSVAGRANSLSVNIAGSGALKAGTLETKKAKVSIAGSGDATVWVREALDVSVAGSADVRYYGDPALSRSILGSGSVKRLGASPG